MTSLTRARLCQPCMPMSLSLMTPPNVFPVREVLVGLTRLLDPRLVEFLRVGLAKAIEGEALFMEEAGRR